MREQNRCCNILITEIKTAFSLTVYLGCTLNSYVWRSKAPAEHSHLNFFLPWYRFNCTQLADYLVEANSGYSRMLYIYTNSSQARLEKKVKKLNQSMQNRFNSIKFTIMYVVNIRSRVFQEIFVIKSGKSI